MSVTSVRTFLFFARAKRPHSTLHFPSCGSLARSFLLVLLSFLSFALSSSKQCPFLQSQRSPSRSFSFLARRFLVSLPSFLHPFALFHLRFSPPLLSINLFFSLRSSGPRNEQRKSIGWHCGSVPSTVVLDLCIGTMYGTCFIKLKSLLRSDVFCTSVLRYSFVPLNLIEIVSVILN